jgi:YHS domain-containing protein
VYDGLGQPGTGHSRARLLELGNHASGGWRGTRSCMGMELMPGKDEAEIQHEERTYHFCSRECRDLFVKNPADYLKKEAQG